MPATIVATADSAQGRVVLTVRGVPAAEAVLVLRRDTSGVEVVRDTSEATALPAVTVIGRNLYLDPSCTATTNHTVTDATKSTVSGRLRVTANSTTPPTAYANSTGTAGRIPATPGMKVAARVGVIGHPTKTFYIRVQLIAYDTGGAVIGPFATVGWGPWAPNLVSAADLFGVAPAGTVTVAAVFSFASDSIGGPVVSGDYMDLDNWRADTGPNAPTVGPYPAMTGDNTNGTGTPTSDYAWTGTPNASTSEQTTQQVVVYDYEPRQGEQTDYLATDTDGVVLATASRITIPAWGTWLKSLGRPFLNTRCYFAAEGPPKMPARRELVQVDGAPSPVALTDLRMTETGVLQLNTLTVTQAAAVKEALSSGETLMLDTAAAWRTPYRYISVGDVTVARGVGDGELGLDRDPRQWTLSEVVEVEPPVGVSQSLNVTVYDDLQPQFGTYAGLAATVPNYNAIVV